MKITSLVLALAVLAGSGLGVRGDSLGLYEGVSAADAQDVSIQAADAYFPGPAGQQRHLVERSQDRDSNRPERPRPDGGREREA